MVQALGVEHALRILGLLAASSGAKHFMSGKQWRLNLASGSARRGVAQLHLHRFCQPSLVKHMRCARWCESTQTAKPKRSLVVSAAAVSADRMLRPPWACWALHCRWHLPKTHSQPRVETRHASRDVLHKNCDALQNCDRAKISNSMRYAWRFLHHLQRSGSKKSPPLDNTAFLNPGDELFCCTLA